MFNSTLKRLTCASDCVRWPRAWWRL